MIIFLDHNWWMNSTCIILQHVLEPSVRASLVNVQRWFLTLAHQPHVQKVLPSVSLCAQAPVYDPKKYAELAGKKVRTIHVIVHHTKQ